MFFYIYSLCTYQNRECVNSSSDSDPFGNNSYCCCLFFTMCVQISMDSNNLKFKALSLNVRGIRTFEKRKSLFNWLTKQNSDICFLQETYSTEEIENQWKSSGLELFILLMVLTIVVGSPFLYGKPFRSDEEGRYLILAAIIQCPIPSGKYLRPQYHH